MGMGKGKRCPRWEEDAEEGTVQFLCLSRPRWLRLHDQLSTADKGAMHGFLLGRNRWIGHLTLNFSHSWIHIQILLLPQAQGPLLAFPRLTVPPWVLSVWQQHCPNPSLWSSLLSVYMWYKIHLQMTHKTRQEGTKIIYTQTHDFMSFKWQGLLSLLISVGAV